jgi:hypothetical protein
MTYHATVRNGTLVVEEPLALPEGSRVEVEVRPAPTTPLPEQSPRTLYERYKSFIGIGKGLPADLSRNHDHYLYGLPKGSDDK